MTEQWGNGGRIEYARPLYTAKLERSAVAEPILANDRAQHAAMKHGSESLLRALNRFHAAREGRMVG